MSEFDQPGFGLNEFERAMLDEFCDANKARTPQEQGTLDQAASELRDQLMGMGLAIESEEQFYAACIVSVATAVNMRKLTEQGLPVRTAESVACQVIAALRPEIPQA